MKTRSALGNSAKFIGGTILICSVLLLTVLGSIGKRVLPDKRTKEAASGLAKPGAARENSRLIEAYGKLPLRFEENEGQTAQEVRYVSRGAGYEFFLTPQEAVLALRPNIALDLSPLHRMAFIQAIREARRAGQMTVIRMHFEGANPEPQMIGTDRLPTKVHYFIGDDPRKWHTNVPSYARVRYAGVYPGVDLVFYGNQRRLEYDFVVAPGADPKAILLKVDGPRKMRINAQGDLVLSVSGGEVELRKPVVYQNVKGERHEIASSYAIARNHCVTFAVGSYDRSEPLIVDPVLNYSTYLGGSSGDFAFAIAVDTAGDAFIAGQTLSTDFPAGAHGAVKPPPTTNSGATFVAELNPAGTQLLYSTYLVGTSTNGGDSAFGIAVDSSGKAYVTGSTFATNFPTTPGSLKPGPLGVNTNGTAFVTKLDPTASGMSSLVYSTYLGGTGGEFGNAIAADAAGNAYIAGITHSVDFPTMNAFQSAPKNAFGTAFLSRIDPTGASLIYSTYLGGTAAHEANTSGPGYGDQAFGVAVDSSSNAYLVGTTTSTDASFITAANAYQSAPLSGNLLASAFLSRIDTTKSAAASLIYSTYLSGSTEDIGFAIALGPNNVAYATGTTNSVDFPHTTGAFQTTGAASGKAFVSLMDTTQALSASLKYSTFLGGTGGDTGFGIRVDSAGNAYVAGTTDSSDFAGAGTLKSLGAFQPALSNTVGNAFVAKLNPAGTGATDLLYATYFGGNGKATSTATVVPDQGFGIAIDSSNPPNAYITGQTSSTDLPVFPKAPASPTAFQTSLKGNFDAYVAKLTLIPTLVVAPTALNFGAVQIGTANPPTLTVTLTNNTNASIAFTSAGVSGGSPSAANTDYTVSANTCTGGIPAGASPANQCTITVKFNPTVVGAETATLVLTDGDSTSPQNVSLTGSGTNAPPDFTLSATPNTLTVARGHVGTATISVNPTGGFNAAVALTCMGAPANSTCVLNPTSITAPTTSTLTFTAHAMLVPLPISRPAPPLNLLRLVPLFVALMLVFLLLSKQRLRTRLAMASAILICITLAACSSGPKKPAPGTYPLTVNGTSGALSHSTTVTVTVN